MDHVQNAESAIRMVREAKELTFDTETSGLDWRSNFPVGWVIGSSPRDVVYVPTRHGGGGNLPDPINGLHLPATATAEYQPHSFEVELAKAFDYRNQNGGGRTIGHNLKFDCHFAANVGVFLGRNLSCTQNTQALINEYTKSFSLDAVASSYGVTAKKGQELYDHMAAKFGCAPTRDSMSRFWELPGDDPKAVDYATGDGVTTLELFHKQVEEIDEQELNVVWELENELIWTLFRMERRGIKVDMDYLQALPGVLQGKVDAALANLPPNFNPRSPEQVQEYVQQFATDWPTTDKGNPSFTEKWLKTFPEGDNVIAVRKWTNLGNSFVNPMLESHSHKGRVHATLNQNKADDHGTVSGRLSCSSPNLQQVPKHDKVAAKLFRPVFVADEGMLIYEGDYSQMEPRMFAHYSGEKALIDGYNADPPRDVHTVVAELFNADRNTKAKRMNMGMFTGMFPKSFAGHMGVSLEEATHLWNQWFDEFPGIRDFQSAAKTRILQRGYVKSILGRRGRLESNKYAYRAVSKIIQNGGADVIKFKMVQVDKELEARGDLSHLLMSVHDSFLWQSPDTDVGQEEAAWIAETMADVQGPPFNMRVPFTVDLGSGRDWAIASFGEE